MKNDKKEEYIKLLSLIKKTLEENKTIHFVTLISELVNYLSSSFDYMDWVGFYLLDQSKESLFLGPYIGKEACEKIAIPQGVCGKAFKDQQTQVVNDVSLIPYHIACSSSTKSEIVIPLIHQGECIGVLDIDSDQVAAFDKDDVQYLKSICYLIVTRVLF